MANYIRAKVPLDAAAVTVAVFCFRPFFGLVVWTAVKVLVGINTRRLAGCWPSGREKIFAPFARSRFRFADKK
jgi:hypothetical protein